MASHSEVYDSIVTKELTVGGTVLPAGRTGRLSVFNAVTNVRLGGWFQAAKAYMDFGTAGTGYIAGKASAFNAELRLPNLDLTSLGGMYAPLEVNMIFQASTALATNTAYPQCMASFQVSGTQAKIDIWEANANSGVFHFGGLGEGDDSIFSEGNQDKTTAATLAIMIGSTRYFICLSSTPCETT